MNPINFISFYGLSVFLFTIDLDGPPGHYLCHLPSASYSGRAALVSLHSSRRMPPKSFAKHEEKLQQAKARAAQTKQIVTSGQTHYVNTKIQTSTGAVSSTSAMPLPPQPLVFLPPPLPVTPSTLSSENGSKVVVDDEPVLKKPTQVCPT